MARRDTTWTRRDVLRGGGGAALALPLLECTMTQAWAQGAPEPRRFLLCSGGFSQGGDASPGGQPLMRPAATGPDYVLPAVLTPLADVRDQFTLVSGLRIPIADTAGDGPTAGRVAGSALFHTHLNPLLTGHRQTEDCLICIDGPSPDQRVAEALAGATRLDSLAWRVQVDGYTPETHRAAGTLSYRAHDDEIVPVEPMVSPHLAWLQVTGGTGRPGARLSQLAQRRSLLDLVDRHASRFTDRLSGTDRERVERHFDEVRALEQRLTDSLVSCDLEPPTVVDPADPGFWYTGETERAALLHEVVRYAFACDLTRVGSLMYTFWKSEIGTRAFTSFDRIAHDTMHHGTHEQVAEIVSWHMALFGDLLRVLASTPRVSGGEGSLLDDCAIVYLPEGGLGGPEHHEKSHSTENMILLTAGGAGGLVRGEHLVAPGTHDHPANVFLAAMEAVGAPRASHGEITSGAMPGLLR